MKNKKGLKFGTSLYHTFSFRELTRSLSDQHNFNVLKKHETLRRKQTQNRAWKKRKTFRLTKFKGNWQMRWSAVFFPVVLYTLSWQESSWKKGGGNISHLKHWTQEHKSLISYRRENVLFPQVWPEEAPVQRRKDSKDDDRDQVDKNNLECQPPK